VSGFTNVSVAGNRLPYAPEHLLSAALGGRTGFGLDVQLEAVHTSAAYTDDLNTLAVVANGQRGEMDGHTVWNLTANYALDLCDCKLYVAAKNLTDELYVVDMSRGLTVGMPRLVQGGFELKF
jgi:Fe(3+) dicitrate transport protein